MKVAFDIKNLWLHGKGIGTFTLNLIKDIETCENHEDFSIELYAPSFEMEGLSKVATERLKKVPTPSFDKRSRIGKFKYDQLSFYYSLQKNDVDLLFSPYFDIPLLWQKPLITTVHDLSIYELKQSYSRAFYLYYERLLRKSVRQSSFIVTVSEYSKSKIVENFSLPGEKVKVIYNKVPYTFLDLEINCNNEEARKVGSFYKLPAEYILYTGGIEARKNINLLIEGVHAARKQNKNVPPLVITGVKLDSTSNDVRSLIEERNVIALGYLPYDHLFYVYKDARLIVNTSSYEGFGIPVLEALTLQKPMLCSDIPVYKEVGNDLVFYFNSNNRRSFEDQLVQIFSGKHRDFEKDKMKRRAAFFNDRNYSKEFFRMINESLK